MDSPISPLELITNEAVVESVKTEFGPNAKLLSWDLHDFIKRLDDYNSYVTSIKVKIIDNGVESQHSYIAKLNPCRQNECWKCITNSTFTREGYFLHDIAPRLCNILTCYNQHPLRLPVDLYSSCTVGKEILISKDLREDHFVMVDGKQGLDISHAKLVLRELARLHAASFLLEEQNIGEELQDTYPFLQDEWGDEHHVYYEMFDKYTQSQLKYTIQLLHAAGGYNKAINWIEENINKIQSIFKEQLQNSESKFKVICHGDLQINNILFRYDDRNQPEEVMLLDLQRAKVTSLVNDLNYFLYTCLDGITRKQNLDFLLQEYYNSFKTVMDASNIPMKFSLDDIHREFYMKNILGLIYGINSGIKFLMESEGISTQLKDNTSDQLDHVKIKAITQNPLFTSRIKSLVDEMLDNKVIR